MAASLRSATLRCLIGVRVLASMSIPRCFGDLLD
jgi:hypothetical protein